MSQAPTHENLARLRRRSPALADVVACADAGCIERLSDRRGEPILRCDGVLLASAYDAKGEGEKLAASDASECPDVLILIGFATGHHVDAFRRRQRCPTAIFEPSPARLRAGLEARPALPWLLDEDLWIGSDGDELGRWLEGRYTPGLRIQVCAHPSALRLAPEAVRDAVVRVGRVKDSRDITAATRVSRLEDWTRLTVENAPLFLATPGASRLRDAFRGVPAIVAAAGPSLDKQLPRIAREAGRLLVIGIGPSLGALRAHGIRPDLVHVLESTDVAHQLLRAGPTEDLNLVLTPKTHRSLYELPVRSRFVAYTAAERFACWLASQMGETQVLPGAGSVAISAVHLAAMLGADPIMLVGQDLAFTDGRVYASGSCYDKIRFESGSDGVLTYTNMEERIDAYDGDRRRLEAVSTQRLVWVEGWNGERVPTSAPYASFIEYYREMGSFLAKSGQRLWNCTEGGARIPGIEHRRLEDALVDCPDAAVDSRARIVAAFDGAEPVECARFADPVERARRALDRLERSARTGERDVARATAALGRCRSASETIAQLRRAGRCERAIRRDLSATPWIEGVVQAELHEALPLLTRASRAQPTPEEALEECRLLLRATSRGVERARELFDRFEEIALPADAEGGR